MQHDSEALSFDQVLGVLRRRLPLVALCVVLVAGAAYAYSKHETKKYTASAALAFSYDSLSQQIAGLSTTGGGSNTLQTQQASNVELVRLGDMAAKTASLLGHGLSEEQVASSVSVEGHQESNVVDVSATATSPVIAAAIANTYSTQFVQQQQSSNRKYFKSALALVRKQLAAMSQQQRTGPDGLQLQNRAQELTLLAEFNYGNVQLAQPAVPPSGPSSPKTSRNTALGIILGLLLGLGLVFVLERLDHRIRRPEDLEAIYRLSSLGTIPKSSALSRSARYKRGRHTSLPPAVAEAFNLIRAHIRFFNIDRELRTIVIASAALGEGKTTIARYLADAAARLGSRVLLVEVELRQPTLARQLDIRPGPGLADVLIGAVPLGDAIQPIELEAPAVEGDRARTLDVLTAGVILPPNPAELLDSYAMDAVLEQTKSTYDLVVIDTPPLNSVSDAFPLLNKVDGIVVVGRIGRSRRDAAERLHQVLASSGAPTLGVIANGWSRGYAYPKARKSYPAIASKNGAAPFEQLVPTTRA